MSVAAPDRTVSAVLEDFQPPAVSLPNLDALFTGDTRWIVQTPPVRNDYKKISGCSDAAHTYDTTAT